MNDIMTKSFLSYVELTKQAQVDLDKDLEIGVKSSPNPSATPADVQNLSGFFQEVTAIESAIEDIENLLFHLQSLNEEMKTTHSAKLLRGITDRMDSDTIAVLRKSQTVIAALESLDRSNASNRLEFQRGSSVDRTRTTVTNGLRTKLKETMNHFQTLRQAFLSDREEDLKRTFYNATGKELGDVSTERIAAEGQKVETIVKMGEKDTGLEGRERQQAAMDIQKSLEKLNLVFLDMAVLVDMQEGNIEAIEQNVADASHFISGGTNSLSYADEMRKKKKWVFWVWIVGIIILLVCFISMLTS